MPFAGRTTCFPAVARLFTAVALVSAVPLSAQNVVVLRAAGGGRMQVASGATLTVPLVADMSAAGGVGLSLIATGVSWDSNRLRFDSVRTGNFGAIQTGTQNAASGSVSVARPSGTITTTTVTVATLYFTAVPGSGGTTLSLTPTAAEDASGFGIRSLVRILNLDVCAAITGVWGDTNGDSAVNIIDAQQLARYTVGLGVSDSASATTRGDVSGDNVVNIIDAQQIARFSVGLSAGARVNTPVAVQPTAASLIIASVLDATAGAVNPGVPANIGALSVGRQAQVRPLVRDAGAADITSCAIITYTSNNPSVATISAGGLVNAISAGAATFTVASGAQSATVSVTVGATFATNSWTNAVGGLWRVASNWSLNRVPTSGDSVMIGMAGTYTVTLDTNVTAARIVVGGESGKQTLSMSSNTLNVNGTLTVAPSGALSLLSSTLNGALDNQGVVVLVRGPFLNGAVTTAAGSTLRIAGDGSCCATNATVATGFTNNGTIELTGINGGNNATLIVTTGTLVNAAGGTITSVAGNGARALAAALDNQGTLDVSAVDMTFTRPVTTTGTVTIGAGRTLTITGSTTFTYASGTVGGAGTLAVSNATLALGGSLSTASLNLVLNNATVTGSGTLVNAVGKTLSITDGTVNVPVDNQGVVLLVRGPFLNGAVTTAAGSTLRIAGDGSCCATNATVANGFTNNGTIELTGINGGNNATLIVTTGTLVNAAGGTITSLAGPGARGLTAALDNQGTLSVAPGVVGSMSIVGNLTTSGVINLELGGVGAFDQLVLTGGTVTLGGTLNVALINAFAPLPGQLFTILTSASARAGTFSTVNLPPGTSVQYNANSVVITDP